LDADEPSNVARMARDMKLRHVVITSVNRDDLEDGGSVHFARTVKEVRAVLPQARVEVLTPDFCGNLDSVARVLDAEPHIFNHNMETVDRLYTAVRPQADYHHSLNVLRFAKRYRPGTLTKSGAMAGLGETTAEVEQLLQDLRISDVDVATLGQYLQPARRNLKVQEFVTPEQFDRYRDYGLSLGFKMVFSGPLVRSSYMADLVHSQAAQA
jgi:lipoic acid synthetase